MIQERLLERLKSRRATAAYGSVNLPSQMVKTLILDQAKS
jgi:hypothetical protein